MTYNQTSFSKPSFSVVIPFYNEEKYLARTLQSWGMQERLPDRIILVNNASEDMSLQIAEDFRTKQMGRINVEILQENRPGKIYALEKSQYAIQEEWAVFCDADTWYPPHYLRRIEQIANQSKESVVCIMALDLQDSAHTPKSQKQIAIKRIASYIFHDKCHTGGFGQTIRVSALRKAGGFSARQWQFVLMDHEIIQRVHKFGSSKYDNQLWCIPSNRRNNRTNVRWTKFEMLLYFIIPFPFGDWFFHRFLRANFLRRGLHHRNLRHQPWKSSSSITNMTSLA